ncbi:MAG: DUF1801 domain-containing protein [Minisyncoccia bacterium]
MNDNQEVTTYITNASKEQHKILLELRKIIHELGGVSEDIKWKFPVFAKDGKDFAYTRTAKDHVTLGFYNIDKIKDPDNLLQGEGDTLKHIKIKSADDVNAPVIREWLHQITH